MEEQIAFRYPRRASATQEELDARRTSVPVKRPRISQRDQSYTTDVDETPDSYYDTRMPTSARRYTTTQNGEQVITQGKRRIVIHPEPPPRDRRHFHWLFWVGIGFIVMLTGWLLLTMLQTWWTNQQNTWGYGYPRTYQTDIVAFKDDTQANPTHVIALNLNGTVEIIVFPHGDASHAKIYIGPTIYTDNPSLIPVTVSFKEVDGTGRLAMLVHVQDQTIIYLNDGSQFQSPKQ